MLGKERIAGCRRASWDDSRRARAIMQIEGTVEGSGSLLDGSWRQRQRPTAEAQGMRESRRKDSF